MTVVGIRMLELLAPLVVTWLLVAVVRENRIMLMIIMIINPGLNLRLCLLGCAIFF